jgi:putative flippase GtrA
MRSPRLRSALVGLASAGLDAGLFALCTLLWAGTAPLLLARASCAALSAVGNYTANRCWAFRSAGPVGGELVRYALAALAGISLTTACWWALSAVTGWDPRLTHALGLGLVWLGFTFPVLRRWVFEPQPGFSGRNH